MQTEEDLRPILQKLAKCEAFGLDTESSGPIEVGKKKKNEFLNVYRSTLTGISLAFPDKTSYYIPIEHRKGNISLNLLSRVFSAIRGARSVCGIHNWKHELLAVSRSPIPCELFQPEASRLRVADTLILAWLINKGVAPNDYTTPKHGLKDLVRHHLGVGMSTFEDTTRGLDFSQLSPQDGLSYACEDAEAALLLWTRWAPELDSLGLTETFWELEMPFVRVLRDMESEGMPIDHARVEEWVDEFGSLAGSAKELWYSLLPESLSTCSLTSPKQLQALYEAGIWTTDGVPQKKTGYGTDGKIAMPIQLALPEDSLGYQLARTKLEYQLFNKLVSTYGHNLLRIADQYPDGRLHSSYNQAGTKTGRLSSSYPNLQNIPKRTQQGKRVRWGFKAPEGWSFVSCDYSQVELRVLAHLTGKGALYDAFRTGGDPHEATGRAMGLDRDAGKKGNFTIIYGAGPKRLSDSLSISLARAKEALTNLTNGMHEEFELKGRVLDRAEERGWVKTLSGRRGYFRIRAWRNRYANLRQEGAQWDDEDGELRDTWFRLGSSCRRAFNLPIQGGARDVITRAMVDVHRELDLNRCRIVGQIHDDLLTLMRDDYIEEGTKHKIELMENAWPLRVPLKVDCNVGKDWSEV